VDNKTVQDRGDGSYEFALESAPSVGSVQVWGFGGDFVIPLGCENCGTLESMSPTGFSERFRPFRIATAKLPKGTALSFTNRASSCGRS
jgi:hypothetical protein